MAVLEAALRTDGANVRLLQRAGRVYLAASRHDEAARILGRAVTASPTTAALERALRLDPAQPAARALLGEAHRARGR